MIRGLDSSTQRPTAAQLAVARTAGVRVWGGYLVSDGDDVILAARAAGQGLRGLAAPWTTAEFQAVTVAGLTALAFLSGNDNPISVGDKARSLGLLPCLDDEDGIRATAGGWQQAWLDRAVAGHYHGLTAAATSALFHLVAYYPGADPGAVWPSFLARPAGPVGWQWEGTHIDPVTGLEVDSLWLADWFAPGARGGEVVFDASGVPHWAFVAPPGADGSRHVFHGWGDLGLSGQAVNGGLEDWGGDGFPLSGQIGIAPDGNVWITVAGPTGHVFRSVNNGGWQALSGAGAIVVGLPPTGDLVQHDHAFTVSGTTGPARPL